MLTKFFILHTDYLFDYTCHTPAGVQGVRGRPGANCEDIAMNFVVSQRTLLRPCIGRRQPQGWGDTRNSEQDLSAVGLSARAGHKKDRGACITEFQRLWGHGATAAATPRPRLTSPSRSSGLGAASGGR